MDTITLDATWVSVFLLALSRIAGWALVTPLFGARNTTLIGRTVLSVSMAILLTPIALGTASVPGTLGGFAAAVVIQFLFGAAFGFLTGILLYAPQVAGSLADLLSGLGYASIVDPASGQQAAVFSRFFSFTFIALLLTTNAYMTVISGFARTFTVIPLGASVPFNPGSLEVFASGVTLLLASAIEVGAPLLGVLLLTELALAMGARFFPQANVTFLGLSLKSAIALVAASAVLILIPGRMDSLIEGGARLAQAVFS